LKKDKILTIIKKNPWKNINEIREIYNESSKYIIKRKTLSKHILKLKNNNSIVYNIKYKEILPRFKVK